MDIPLLPTVNASLNFTAAVLLFLGWKAIKSGQRDQHKRLMISAFSVSAAFLACYLYYHYTKPGATAFAGPEYLKPVYLLVLIPHIVLATLMVPFIVTILAIVFIDLLKGLGIGLVVALVLNRVLPAKSEA